MKLALIPPIQLLSYTEASDHQLMLPQLLRNNIYSAHYDKLCRTETEFVMMDNGAAEAEPLDPEAVVLIAKQMGVTEVVASDVLRDPIGTRQSIIVFLDAVKKHDYEGRIAIVAQGQKKQAVDLASEFIEQNLQIRTVCIPRSIVSMDNPWARLEIAMGIHTRYPFIDIHLFGASNVWPKEVLEVAQNMPFIRSMDTSMPFVYAWSGIELHKDGPVIPVPHREGDMSYFTSTWGPDREAIVNKNVNRMLMWADGIA
jgi:hypothetical protein